MSKISDVALANLSKMAGLGGGDFTEFGENPPFFAEAGPAGERPLAKPAEFVIIARK